MKPDDEIKKKLSEMFKDFESEPTEESWDKIRASMQLSQLFQDFEAEPQDESWEKIRAGLDLAQNMKEYEPEPIPIQVVYRRGRFQSAKVKCFIDFLIDEFKAGLS